MVSQLTFRIVQQVVRRSGKVQVQTQAGAKAEAGVEAEARVEAGLGARAGLDAALAAVKPMARGRPAVTATRSWVMVSAI